MRCGDAKRDRRVERATRHGTNGVTAGCDARTNREAEVFAEWALHGGHREHNEGEQECEHDLCNCCLSPAIALAWCQWERLAALHGRVGACRGDSGNDLDNNIDASILWRALVTACGNNGNSHRRVEVSSRASSKSENHAHQRCCNGEDWCLGATNHVQTDGQHKEVCAKELAEDLGRNLVVVWTLCGIVLLFWAANLKEDCGNCCANEFEESVCKAGHISGGCFNPAVAIGID